MTVLVLHDVVVVVLHAVDVRDTAASGRAFCRIIFKDFVYFPLTIFYPPQLFNSSNRRFRGQFLPCSSLQRKHILFIPSYIRLNLIPFTTTLDPTLIGLTPANIPHLNSSVTVQRSRPNWGFVCWTTSIPSIFINCSSKSWFGMNWWQVLCKRRILLYACRGRCDFLVELAWITPHSCCRSDSRGSMNKVSYHICDETIIFFVAPVTFSPETSFSAFSS